MTSFFSRNSFLAISGSIFAIFLMTSNVHAASIPLNTIKSGDLVRGETQSSVYYFGEDGMRYVFPNEKIYLTWYPDFKNVKWISDADLSLIQIGGNVTYKPGSKLIQIESDPMLYTLSKNGTLRAIDSDSLPKELYGSTWKKQIDLIPASLAKDYHKEGVIQLATQYSPVFEQKEAESINSDKSLHAAILIHITDSGYDVPTAHVVSGHAVRWINDGIKMHSASEWDRIWGSGTLSTGATFTKYFSEKGTWSYYSKYDEKANVGGAIVVE